MNLRATLLLWNKSLCAATFSFHYDNELVKCPYYCRVNVTTCVKKCGDVFRRSGRLGFGESVKVRNNIDAHKIVN